MINRLFAYCLLTAAVAGQQIPELEAIKRLEAAKQFKNAALRAEQIILQYPSRWEPHHAAAQNWGRVRRFRKAQTHLEIARQINPDVAKVLFDLASVLYNQAKWDEALHYFRELQALAGRDASAQGRWQVPYFSGVCAQKLEYVEEAIDAYNRAVNMTTGNRQGDYQKELDIRNRLAGTMLNSGRTPAALYHFKRLVAMQPNKAEFHYFLGVSYLKLGKLKEAEKSLLDARRRNPDDFRTPLRLGKVYRRQKELLKAQSFFQLSAEKNPQAYEPWYALRQIYTQTNNLDEADKAHAKYE
ncbi:MAG: tetratricopeptide repeat protein, partial [Planctomycetes bacterium]|nr:tetratricopeptide repeat protein [Planctomycetota bacterium]